MATQLFSIQKLDNQWRYYSRWKLVDGTIIETSLTEREYLDLGKVGAGEPKRGNIPKDAKWLMSANMIAWDTPDKKSPFGGYTDMGNRKIAIGIDELNPLTIDGMLTDLMSKNIDISVGTKLIKLRDGTIEKI